MQTHIHHEPGGGGGALPHTTRFKRHGQYTPLQLRWRRMGADASQTQNKNCGEIFTIGSCVENAGLTHGSGEGLGNHRMNCSEGHCLIETICCRPKSLGEKDPMCSQLGKTIRTCAPDEGKPNIEHCETLSALPYSSAVFLLFKQPLMPKYRRTYVRSGSHPASPPPPKHTAPKAVLNEDSTIRFNVSLKCIGSIVGQG